MPEYKTERNKDGYYAILEDGKPKGDFEILNDARLTVKWLNEKQAVIDAQNERADEKNKRISELEATLADNNDIIDYAEKRISELEARVQELETTIKIAYQYLESSDTKLTRHLRAMEILAQQTIPARMELPMPVKEIKVLADDDPAPGLD